MDLPGVLVWIVALSCMGYIVRGGWTDRENMRGWFWVALGLLAVTLGGWLSGRRRWLIAGEFAWGLLVLAPALLAVIYTRCHTRQRFGAARRVAGWIRWLHPGDGWKEIPELMRALELAQAGREEEALEIFRRHQDVHTANGLLAASQLYRLTHRWEDLMQWRHDHLSESVLARHPGFLPIVLRAFGETGDLNGMLAWFEQFAERIERLPGALRGFCRLPIYVFCGRRPRVEQLFREGLSGVPEETRVFWIATADLADGRSEEAHARLSTLRNSRDHLLRAAVQRRLKCELANPQEVLSEGSRFLLEQIELHHDQEQRYAAQPGLWTRHASGTLALIAANLILFVLEIALGGSTDGESLYRLGALTYPAFKDGEWWRLGANLFLHFGPAHLFMNLLALAVLGPFVEFVLGLRRFLMVYLIAGLIAAGAALVKMAAMEPGQSLVGASGSIMGLVGATAAIAYRGWRRERARPASRRLVFVGIVLLSQTLFDLITPQVSMTAHLAGALTGFVLVSALKHGRAGS